MSPSEPVITKPVVVRVVDAQVPRSADRALVQVAVGVLIRGDDSFLLTSRPEGKAYAGYWEFPGGKVDNGESPEVALIRELEEELGIIVSAQDLVPETFASAPLGDRNLVLLLYRCAHWAGTPKPIYATDIQWLLPQDMAVLPMPPADYPLVQKLQSL